MFKVSEVNMWIGRSVILHIGRLYQVSWRLDSKDPTRKRGMTVDGGCIFPVSRFLISAESSPLSPILFRRGISFIRAAVMTPSPGWGMRSRASSRGRTRLRSGTPPRGSLRPRFQVSRGGSELCVLPPQFSYFKFHRLHA
ncbi:hypothetical protein PIB30_107844, partial [Stylosanthes scabra]|nr:hypothetical protein [Stylosanthes scabra]